MCSVNGSRHKYKTLLTEIAMPMRSHFGRWNDPIIIPLYQINVTGLCYADETLPADCSGYWEYFMMKSILHYAIRGQFLHYAL